MHVLNHHQREIAAPLEKVGALLDTLSGHHDALWPRESWPAMRFDRPLQQGAIGGHGPIGYVVESYSPGRTIRFRFTRPRGFDGTHAFEVRPSPRGSVLSHTLSMSTSGIATLLWVAIFRPLHDALIEDSLALAAAHAGTKVSPPEWSPRVQVLRQMFRRSRR